MISCIIATLLATRMQSASIYTLKLLRRGVDIHSGRALNVLQPVPVGEVMRSDVVTVPLHDSLASLVSSFVAHPGNTLFVTDSDNRLEGVITADQIRPVMTDASSLDTLVIAEDVMDAGGFPTVSPTDSLAEVMKLLGTYRGELPVLQDGRLIGVIWPEDVIERYNTEVFKRDMAHGMASAMRQEANTGFAPTARDSAVAEVPIPPEFVGRTIQELKIRQDYGVSVLMIKQTPSGGQERLRTGPGADYTFEPGDVMLVLGSDEALRHLRAGIPRRGPKP
jgi:CIC family chloride channel protein